MSNSKSKSGGVGFASLLLLAFIVLKLCKVIDWSWWWVLSPLWIPIGICLIAVIGYLILVWSDKPEKRTIQTKSKWQQRLDEMQQKKAQ